MKWTSWASLLGLGAIMAVVVATSFDVGTVRCEVCITFAGREACRAVDGANEPEATQAAVTNVCALLASGVTDSMACARTTPTSTRCGAP